MGTVHVIGAGVAGLSAAVRLVDAGARVIVHESAAQAGGRARSFHDEALDCHIDNGNHLLLSGNRSALDYLALIGAEDRLDGPTQARFDFFDLDSGERWAIELNRGPAPLWMLYKSKRAPGTTLSDYLKGLKLLTAGNRSVAELFADQGQMYRRFWQPFAVAVLNTAPQRALARALVPVIGETLARGAGASRPLIARRGLSDTFIDPAVTFIERGGGAVRLAARVRAIDVEDGAVRAIRTSQGREHLGDDDGVVVAAPPWQAVALVAGITCPDRFAPIVNVHYRLPAAAGGNGRARMLGIIGGNAQWLFTRGDVASVTISAADGLADLPAGAIAARIWPEVARALQLDLASMPAVRVIKERRATFEASAEQWAKRPAATAGPANLVLAGDWTDTGLPATIEGAIRSGEVAARALMDRRPGVAGGRKQASTMGSMQP